MLLSSTDHFSPFSVIKMMSRIFISLPLALQFHVQSLLLAIFTPSCTLNWTHEQKSMHEKEGLLLMLMYLHCLGGG